MADETQLYYVWSYNDVDRRFWIEYLADWLPADVFDAHVHIGSGDFRTVEMTDEMRKQYWVNELTEPITADETDRCDRLVYPDRRVRHLAFGWPSLEFDTEAQNDYVEAECNRRGWPWLTLLVPQWSPERLAAELDRPGCVGAKPYYAMLGHDPTSRDRYIEAGIFEFLPREHLEVLNARGAWVTLHVPKADRLGHPDNIAEIRELRRRYPNVVVVIAHLGRCYTLPHATESLDRLADDPGLFWDLSAVLNIDVLRYALATLGPGRCLYGTDNPVFYMRGRRQWHGRTYVNRTSHPFHFNTDRESPEIEAGYTLYMYEQLLAIRTACDTLRLTPRHVEAIFIDNAERLLARVTPVEPTTS